MVQLLGAVAALPEDPGLIPIATQWLISICNSLASAGTRSMCVTHTQKI